MTSEAWPLGDDPIDGVDSLDTLDRTDFVRHVVAVLGRVRRQGESSVVGLVADWGAGKSSIVNMVKGRLKEQPGDDPWLIAEYNPWSYSDLDSLILGFFAELRNAMPDDTQWSESRENVGKLAKAVSPLGKIGGIIGLDVGPVIERLGDLISGDVSVSARRTKAEETLKKLGRPILVILDDLDRLAPAELLLVFKLVRLVGRLPNTYYLLCYDEKTLLDVLRRTELVGDDLSRAQDYMEKMVQVRIDLPPLREVQIAGYVDGAISAIQKNYNIELKDIDVERIAAAYRVHLRDRLTTPRAINRLFAQVDAFYGVLAQEVNFADYLVLTFLRTSEAGVYRMLYLYKEELIRRSPGQLTGRISDHEVIAVWSERLKDVGVSQRHIEGVLALLGILFPALRSAVEEMSASRGFVGDVTARCGVGDADYFDRYFAFGIPAEDIADSVVAEAMRQLSRNTTGPEIEELARLLVQDTEKAVRKIAGQREHSPVPARGVIGLLAKTYGKVAVGHIFTSRPRFAIALLTCTLLGDLDGPEGQATLRAIAGTDSGRELAIRATRTLRQAQASGERSSIAPVTWTSDAEDVMLEIIKERLSMAAESPLTEIPCSLFKELLWGWHSLNSSDVRVWLWGQIDAGHWLLVDLIVHYSSIDVSYDGSPLPHPVFEKLNLDEIDGLLSLSRVFNMLENEIDSALQTDPPRAGDSRAGVNSYILWMLHDRHQRIVKTAVSYPPK
jgi:hypothetical protein